MYNITFLPALTRGNKNIGWLDGYQSFNFGDSFDPDRAALGPLLVFNDDFVQPGTGFGTHAHQNMEIISIPLSGTITHQDSTGKEADIRKGDVQVMSAGTGIAHSEYNHGNDELNFLQIWIKPNQLNVPPRYDQSTIDERSGKGLQLLVAPGPRPEGLWIYGNAWISSGTFDKGEALTIKARVKGNALYVFMIDGEAEVPNFDLSKRDAIKITEFSEISFNFSEISRVIVLELTMAG